MRLEYNCAHMPLTSGTKFGPYEIQSLLGAGGMGEVYRARDTRLDRTVAIKVLPAHLSENAEFKQRFEREARAISSLNHPHICHLYDVGSQDGTNFLVMEFLDGETLAERLRRGAMPVQELLKTGMEIAEALELAHRTGIVHRDLKPGNIMLTKAGAKLMDFGLAKPALVSTPGSGSVPLLLSAARTMSGASPVTPLTTVGGIVGTIQYMSPEQIEGKDADARSDIFAFGAVLYEMATGKRAFGGKSQITVASAILESDPAPISAIKPQMPPPFAYLVVTCLAKERDDRLQSVHDVRLQLKGISQSLSLQSAAAASTSQLKPMLVPRLMLAVAALLLAAAAIVFYFAQRATAPALAVRAYIPPPHGTSFRPSGFDEGPVVVSPDGKMLAFTAVDEKGTTNLWLRPLDAQQATILPGTEDAATPFWSRDGRYLGFIAARKLRKISISGGEAQTLTEAESYRGDWNEDGTILFMKKNFGPIYRIPASGGEASAATTVGKSERAHYAPAFLPDGKHFLYAAALPDAPDEIKVGSLDNPALDGIAVAPGDRPRFASGHLLFVRGGHVLAQPFDPTTFKLSGDPQSLGEARTFSLSPNGVLAYHESSSQSELKIFDRGGNIVATPGPLAAYHSPKFSPDGKSIAVTVEDPRSATSDIWIYPVTGGQPTRFTFGPNDHWPHWSADGKEILYSVRENGKNSIRRRALDGRQPEETLYTNTDEAYVNAAAIDWSHDGKYVSMDRESKDGSWSIWILPLAGDRTPFRPPAISAMSASHYDGLFSPDSRSLAYFSYETGRPEVYVVPFLTDGAKYQVSTTGAYIPRFSRSGEFFFVTMGSRLMVGQIARQGSFRLDASRPLFQLDLPNFAGPSYDVTADGQRFVVLTADHTKSTSITLLTNWPSELKK
jgi:eukaryotic-like serine/threonine-protein kinase